MTVKELIIELLDCPMDAIVMKKSGDVDRDGYYYETEEDIDEIYFCGHTVCVC